jgi:hypothetical protein
MKNFKILAVINGTAQFVNIKAVSETQARKRFEKKHPNATISTCNED